MNRPLVIVTGAAGGIGRVLCRALARRYTVVGMDRSCEGTDFECIEFDLSDAGSVADALRRVTDAHGPRIASVIHLAAYFDFTGEDHPLYEMSTSKARAR